MEHPTKSKESGASPGSGPLSRLTGPLKIAAGFALLIIGVILSIPGIPGPGIVVIVFGLLLLSERFPSARRLLVWGRAKLERLRGRKRAGGDTAR